MEDVTEVIKTAIKSKFIVAGTGVKSGNSHGVLEKKAYAIIAWDEGSDKMTLRSPFGKIANLGADYNDAASTFKLTLADLKSIFTYIVISYVHKDYYHTACPLKGFDDRYTIDTTS